MTAGSDPARDGRTAAARKFPVGRRHEFKRGFFAKLETADIDIITGV
jgi:acetaldehyde dehydrogenase (acetylating)